MLSGSILVPYDDDTQPVSEVRKSPTTQIVRAARFNPAMFASHFTWRNPRSNAATFIALVLPDRDCVCGFFT
jgi:hypothetical protein